MSSRKKPTLVSCPQELDASFRTAEEMLGPVFEDLKRSPQKGEIKISDMRYILVRTESISIELHEELKKNFGDAGAWRVAYRLGKALGKRDAKNFHDRFDLEDPIMKLSLGPVHFAHVGWAFVEILPESNPQPNEDYFLVYNHPYSFEADAFLDEGIECDAPVCHMNAGYSCGWCEISFGIDLEAEEITCRGMGHDRCTFVMAHPKHIKRLRDDYRKKHNP